MAIGESDQQHEIREQRADRKALGQGLRLEKSPLRDPRTVGYGRYQLVSIATDAVMAGDLGAEGLTLDEVEAVLDGQG
ncbi:hypothetical protein [Arthrobacter castelli]|uniref:hypothetical protein n=1 Tax=Arthrobacter castelli TaxID=271431 RepID=UPI00041E6903|nr:hypothetical protein [Arthrobacter castelli]